MRIVYCAWMPWKCTKRRAKSLMSLLVIDAVRVACLLTNGLASLIWIRDSRRCFPDLFGRSAPLFTMISLVGLSVLRRILYQWNLMGIDYGWIGCLLKSAGAATSTHLNSLSDRVLCKWIRCATLIQIVYLDCGHFLLIIGLYSFNNRGGRRGQCERIDWWPGNCCCGGKRGPTEAARGRTRSVSSICRVTV